MTASKSSRARNARIRAQSGAARDSGTAVKTESASTGSRVKTESAKADGTVRAGNAGRNGSAVKTGNGDTARGAGRNGSPGRNGSAVRDGGRGTGRGGTERGGTGRNGTGRNSAAEGGARSEVQDRGPRSEMRDRGARDRGAQRGPAAWLQLTTFALALAGLGVSIYLTIAHFTESALLGCSESGLVNCTRVTTSPQSYVFGIPVAVLGLAFYVFLAAIMSPWAWQAARREIHLVRVASLVVGIGFVLYLIYAELLIIGNICLYCTSVHILTFALFVLTASAAAVWGLKPGAAWKPRLGRRSQAAPTAG